MQRGLAFADVFVSSYACQGKEHMAVRIVTRHGEDFDICTERVDLRKSSYADAVPGYIDKVAAFYE